MKALLQIFLSGLALSGCHLLVALLLTPFFGNSPFLWANIFVAFLFSLSIGLLLDSDWVRKTVTRRLEPRFLFLAAGLCLSLCPLLLAPITRFVLDALPGSYFSIILTCLVLLVIPGGLLSAASVACLGQLPRARVRAGLFALLSGALVGIPVVAPALLSHKIPASVVLGAFGWIPLLIGVFALEGLWQALGGAVLMVLVAWLFVMPGEIGSLEYRTALRRAFQFHVGRYYLSTAGRRVLDQAEIRDRYKQVLEDIKNHEDPGAQALIQTVQMLKSMGRVETTGEGLGDTLRSLISEDARRYVMPLLEPFEKISSDGQGQISIVLKPQFRGKQVRIPWNAKAGEQIYKLVFAEDFSLVLRHNDVRSHVKIEPERIEKAGFFEVNETHWTPVQIQDVKLFVDATLLAFIIENQKDRIKIKVRAQGSVGGVVEEPIYVLEK